MLTKEEKKKFLGQVGRNARFFRKEKDITITEMSKNLKVNPSTITRFEQGRIDSITLLVAYLNQGISIYNLMEGVEIYEDD